MPARKLNVLERQAPCGKNKKVADVRKEPTVMTRSMQRKEENRQNLCDSVDSLPSLSRILIRTINLCKSARGLSLTHLDKVLGAKGYSMSRYCPSIKRQLKLLSSRGALVKMTHKAGSSYFVITKHQEKVATNQASEKIIGTRKTGAERTNPHSASEKMNRTAQRAKSSGIETAEANQKVLRLNRNQKLRQPPSSAKAFQRPNKKTVSTIERPHSSRSKPSTGKRGRRPNRKASFFP
ncbi:histone H1.01-like [Sphaerodactylus townsendi]|uniref:histone H1.01-like n=1 Tax=Sphaerodactylus townsendi TaxID=933632 RepID=UPI002026A1A4|nr:histone H1.01-like [Sphaerodactylus townsendi]